MSCRCRDLGAVALVLVTLCGCQALQPKQAENPIAQTKFQSCSMIYRHLANGSSREMIVTAQYPSKSARADHARVEVIVLKSSGAAAKPSWVAGLSKMIREHVPGVQLPDGVEEAYGLDVPLTELERGIQSLAESGYFANPQPESADVLVEITLDGQHSSRAWRSVKGIEAIASKARHEGDLVSVSGLSSDLLRPMVSIAAATSPSPASAPSGNSVYTASNGYQAITQPAMNPWPSAQTTASTPGAALASGSIPIESTDLPIRLPSPTH